MMKSSLGNTKEAHLGVSDDFEQQEDVKLYSQLPDYDDFQGYDLGVGGVLSRIAHKIYAGFHKPSWRTLKHHWFMAKIQKKLFRELNDVAENDKRTIPGRKGCLAW